MNISNASTAQLKGWLSEVKEPTTGTKRELILRLNNLTNEKRNQLKLLLKSEEEDFDGSSNNNVQKGKRNNGKDGEHKDDESDSEAGDSNEDGDEKSTVRNDKSNGEHDDKSGVRSYKNNSADGARNNNSGDGNSDENEVCDSEDGGGEKMNKECGKNKRNTVGQAVQNMDLLLRMATEAVNEFSGDTCARKWILQVKNIASVYGIKEPYIKMLIVSKIKGKACMWLHADPERVLLPTEQLAAELISMFGERKSKLETRRKFEERKWTASESFVAYADDKVMLAHGIKMDKEELVALLIEGIPNQMLRNQARIQCFEDIQHIKKAFAEVKLPKVDEADKKVASVNNNSSTLLRCFNCNSKGHWAKECRKPKREKGSCYACGEMGHFAAKCLKNKNGDENNYVRYFEINFMNNAKSKFITACLIDTGSPISFIKISKVPKDVIGVPVLSSFYGLNKSPLKTYGKILCYIMKNLNKIHFNLIMVANESMNHDVVLGRDFMEACNLILNLDTLKMITVDKIESRCNKKSDKMLKEENMYNNNKTVSDSVSQGSSKSQMSSDTVKNKLEKAVNAEISKVEREMFEINVIDDSIDYKIGDQVDHSIKCQFIEFVENCYVNKERPNERRFGAKYN